jgi:hypothetical protein
MTPLAPGTPNSRLLQALHLTQRTGLQEVAFVLTSFLIYFFIRGAVVDRVEEAMDRAYTLIQLEQNLGFYWELQLQALILDHYWAIKAMNWIYFWGHMPLVIILAVWLYIWHRPEYVLTRNAFLLSGAIGVVMYALWPVAPPRLLDEGFVDTMALYDRVGYNAQETAAFVNQYAALPSLHFGWSLLLGVVVAKVGKRPWFVAFGIIWPVAMFFAIVMTGNHFIIDAIAGAAVSFVGLGLAYLLRRAWPHILRSLDSRIP